MFLYGFASQVAFGVAIWLTCRLGRAPLLSPAAVTCAGLFWNLGVKLGVYGILRGDSTGFPWLEMPRYAFPILFCSYALIGVLTLITFHGRRERELYVSLWYVLAALFWFPWVYSAGNLMLVFWPVRGVLQVVVNSWFTSSLKELWLGSIGVAAIFYFLPKILGRPLYSRYLALYSFWLAVLFGSWGGIFAGAPLPKWIPAISTMASVLLVVPVIAVATNCYVTFGGEFQRLGQNPPLRFIIFGLAAYVLAGLLGAFNVLPPISAVLRFTYFQEALVVLNNFGFFGMVMFGSIYYIVPRLIQQEWPSAGLLKVHFWASASGILLCVVSLIVGGVQQGLALNDPSLLFLDVVKTTFPYLTGCTLGVVLLAVANAGFLCNLLWALVRYGCAICPCAGRFASNAKPAITGVTR
jgi:cytochrome c oxidase cbb3-type subunit 1